MLDDDAKAKLLMRLRRVGGQVEAVARLIETDAYCVDTLTQLSAATGALARVAQIVLESHVKTCVRTAMVQGDAADVDAKLEELVALFRRYAHVIE